MVTAEIAVTIPAVVLVLVLALAGISLGTDRLRCQDAARLAARELARGESADRARADAVRALPPGATVTLGRSGRTVSVTVLIPTGRALRSVGVPATMRCASTALVERDPG